MAHIDDDEVTTEFLEAVILTLDGSSGLESIRIDRTYPSQMSYASAKKPVPNLRGRVGLPFRLDQNGLMHHNPTV